MSEEQILEQVETPAKKENALTKIAEHKLLIFLPAALAVVAILLGYFVSFLPLVTGTISYGFDFLKWNISNYISGLFSNTGSFIFALALPAAVIVAKKVNKPIFTRILLFVSLGFLAVQLLAAFVCLIFSFFNVNTAFLSGVRDFFSGFCGAEVLSSLVYMLKTLFSGVGFVMKIGYVITDVAASFAALLFILKNVLCGLLCLMMLKKQ